MTKTQQAFINAISPQAVKEWRTNKVLPSLIMAQAILESGWGQSGLTKSANNLFGIKCGSSWKGESVRVGTKEFQGGRWTTVIAYFRKYKNWSESIADHSKLLQTDRYKPMLGITNYIQVCTLVQKLGYATDPKYTKKLIDVIECYELYKYDDFGGVLETMDIKNVQRWLNQNGFTDKNGNKLVEDGKDGVLTQSAKEKAKDVLNFVLGK